MQFVSLAVCIRISVTCVKGGRNTPFDLLLDFAWIALHLLIHLFGVRNAEYHPLKVSSFCWIGTLEEKEIFSTFLSFQA